MGIFMLTYMYHELLGDNLGILNNGEFLGLGPNCKHELNVLYEPVYLYGS